MLKSVTGAIFLWNVPPCLGEREAGAGVERKGRGEEQEGGGGKEEQGEDHDRGQHRTPVRLNHITV